MKILDIINVLENEKIAFSFYGEEEADIVGFSSLNEIHDNTMIWIGNENAKKIAEQGIPAKLAIAQMGIEVNCENIIITNESRRAFFTILNNCFSAPLKIPLIGQGSIIGDHVKLGSNVRIGHNCIIEGEVSIGSNTTIFHNVTILNDVKIGNNCEIQSGVRIGHDGFGYFEDHEGNKTMIKHHGGVLIEDNVFIGANTEVARGTIDDTIIGEGTKIDSLSHIAHNVKLGKNNGIVAGTTIYGSVKTSDNCYIATSVIKDQISLGSNVFVGMNSTVLNDIEDNKVVVGTPAHVIRDKF